MSACAIQRVVGLLKSAGLELSLTPDRALKVKPASKLNTVLRDLIHESKPLLVDWLTKSVTSNLDDPDDWKLLAAAYDAHHFDCSTCVAAGLGYGLRCRVGMALWNRSQA